MSTQHKRARKHLQRTRTVRAIAARSASKPRKGYPLARYARAFTPPPPGRLTQRVAHPSRVEKRKTRFTTYRGF